MACVWRERELRTWRADVSDLSADPRFEDEFADVVGLCLDPPEHAVVFSFGEKAQIQTLDRAQPSLPTRAGRTRSPTHDYKHNGTVGLFAALDVTAGQVLALTRRRHTGKDVLAFFKHIDALAPQPLDVHVILDNVSAHRPTRASGPHTPTAASRSLIVLPPTGRRAQAAPTPPPQPLAL